MYMKFLDQVRIQKFERWHLVLARETMPVLNNPESLQIKYCTGHSNIS